MDTVDIDVENLFNDGQLDDILPGNTLQPTTLAIPGLAEHFLNLRFGGGVNRISWSRQGHIAIISEDGSIVDMHCLRSSTEKKRWVLSNPRPLETTFEDAVNVTWSPSGLDLAIVDKMGRVGIFSMTTTCLNRLNESRPIQTDPIDELGMPIGTWWLNQDRSDRPRNVIANATRGDDKWAHNTTKAKAHGPLYPRAFCVVNRQGIFNLLYQRPGARYTRTSVQLPFLSGQLCSHAAFSPTAEGKILIAVYSVTENLSVYHVQILWPLDLMTDPTSTTLPELLVETVSSCVSMWTEVNDTAGSLSQAYKPDDWSLTQLVIVPTSDVETAVHEPPCLWAVYTSSNQAIDATSDGFLLNSVVRRWSVSPFMRTLHSSFDDIPTKTEVSGSEENVFVVERLADLILPQMITSIELLDSGHMVAISTADGRTELWNPVTQALVSFEGQQNEITSLAQFGFAFPPAINTIITALSPNACSSLTITNEQRTGLQHVQYPIQTTGNELDLNDHHQSASVAAIVLAFARSCWSNSNGDDVLSCVLTNYTQHQYPAIMSEMYKTLFRDTEFIHERAPNSEVERLVSKPIVSKILSFQMALLGSDGMSISSPDENIRYAALSSVWAWMSINLRYVVTTFYIFYRECQTAIQAQQNPGTVSIPSLSPAFADAICNAVQWTLDLFRFMLSAILEIGDRQTNPDFFTQSTFANNLGDANGDGSQGLVALILNCQWSRTFFGAINRAMRAFIDFNEKSHNPLVARIVNAIRKSSVEKGMSISTIDRLLDSRWYTRNGLQEGEQMNLSTIAKRQMAMCSTGRVGPEYAGMLRTLLDRVINEPETGLRATGEVQRLKLWTDVPDLNWLLLGFNPQFLAQSLSTATAPYIPSGAEGPQTASAKTLFDVHRKSKVIVTGSPDQLVRRCVRCGGVSGDVDGVDKTWSKSMVPLLARCVCDAYWILEPLQGEVKRK